ncbi:MAG: hypothetical protein ACFFG0_33640 [Candidatus Thorarchaeota archaeon]
MIIKVVDIELDDRRGLRFENLNGWEDFDYLSQIIEEEYKGINIQFVMEGYFGVKWYYLNKIVFELIYDEDIGIYIKSLDRIEFINNYLNNDLGQGFKILAEVDFSQIKENNSVLKEIADDIVSLTNLKLAHKEIFSVNEYISLELVKNMTFIIIDGKPFSQCLGLYLIIPTDKKEQEKIKSIDQADENFNIQKFGTEYKEFKLKPEEEFWGHCSNIQAWVENDYDTRLIHYNLAFPLLKRLTEVGDPLAKRVFKEEIAKRYKSGFPSVVKFLEEEHYLRYLTKEELEVLK